MESGLERHNFREHVAFERSETGFRKWNTLPARSLAALFLLLLNFSYRHVQNQHTILRNFGILGQGRYFLESLGPELRHSLFPLTATDRTPFRLILGEERGVKEPYTLRRPLIISAMSYGALGENAVRAFARGAALAGIPMNTGEGGYPKYHLQEEADLIFQLGTAKFGARDTEGRLDPDKLREIAVQPQVRMIEVKFSQGAKPGKGGLLPKEKITSEIAELRGVPVGEDVVSPPRHLECTDLASTVTFIERIQSLVDVLVGKKMAVGSLLDVRDLVREMKRRNVFPDWITVDGGEESSAAKNPSRD